jgi:hypothetical protein
MNVLSLLILLVVVVGGYTYLWFYTAEKLEDWLVGSVAKLEQEGYSPSYDRIEIKGFPFKLEARLLNPCIQCPKPVPFKISGSGLITATTSVWNPRQIKITGNEKISCFLLGDESEEFPLASIDQFQIQGALANNFFNNYLIVLKGFQLGTWKMQDITFACTNDHSQTTADKIIITVNNMSFTSVINKLPLASTIQQIALEANVSRPQTFDGQLTTILKGWYDQEGVIDLMKLNLVWDDIRLEGNGTLSLDQDLQPLGAFTVNVYGIDPVLKIMTNQKILHKNVVPILKTVLSTLLGTDENKQEVYHSLPISLQDRELSIASIPIMKFDLINWSEINF